MLLCAAMMTVQMAVGRQSNLGNTLRVELSVVTPVSTSLQACLDEKLEHFILMVPYRRSVDCKRWCNATYQLQPFGAIHTEHVFTLQCIPPFPSFFYVNALDGCIWSLSTRFRIFAAHEGHFFKCCVKRTQNKELKDFQLLLAVLVIRSTQRQGKNCELLFKVAS